MWKSVPAQTRLYRVTRTADVWPDPVRGYGAFFKHGARYHTSHQLTVYASDDPLVALAEYAFHQVIEWCELAAGNQAIPFPLRATARLWCFTSVRTIPLIDLLHSTARNQFHYPAHAPFNPFQPDYTCTQQLANRIRNYLPPQPQARPEGLFAPSIRTPRVASYQPSQVVLFIFPPGIGPGPLDQSCQLVADWEVELEMRSAPARRAVTASTPRIDWLSPRFKLRGNPATAQPAAGRPGGVAITPNVWHDLSIQYAAC